jgi:hypothetical protein
MKNTVLVITQGGMGSGPPDLQLRLLLVYLKLLLVNGLRPGAICFYTNGVKLLIEGSPVLESLKSVESEGVRMIACKTCLDYFNIGEKIQVGVIWGMGDIQAAMAMAAKVITL